MAKPARNNQMISVDRIYLFSENPRHKPLETQTQIISQLCKHEQVLQLARDIVRHGLNPLERFAVFLDENSTGGDDAAFIVAEGNRRMCALKLLNDPDLAPPEVRKDLEKLGKGWEAILEVPATVFTDRDDLDLWLERTHQGEQGGVGRKNWNAEQKQRHSGDTKNRTAQALLDYAEQNGLIKPEERSRKLTTVQRFVGNPLVRDALGLVTADPAEVLCNRPPEDFNILVKKFVGDLMGEDPKINSRANKAEITAYARELSSIEGQTRKSIEPQSLRVDDEIKVSSPRPNKPKPHKHVDVIPYSREIDDSLKALKSMKLSRLYTSICSIRLPDHVPLMAVGIWAFFETLSARAGREEKHSFESFFSNHRLAQYGFSKGGRLTAVREAISRIAVFGNSTKHHDTSAAFSGDQLANDMDVLRDVIIACATEALTSGGATSAPAKA